MTASGTATRLPLRDIMDAAYPNILHLELQALRGRPTEIDGSSVLRTSTLSLQVLVSAAATWKSDGFGFRLVGASVALAEAIRTLGVSESQLQLDAVNS